MIDLAKMNAIMKWPIPNNVSEVNIFLGETQELRKFIDSCLGVATPLHVVTTSGKIF